MCTKKELEQNWNRTMIEATRLFFFLRRIDFFLYPQKSFSCPWHISCIIFKTAEDHNPTRGALLPLQQRLSLALRGTSTPPTPHSVFYFFNFFLFIFIIPLKRQNPKCNLLEEESICGRAGLQFVVCPSRVWLQTPPGSRWHVSVDASSIWDAKESAADGDSEGGKRDARRGISGRVSTSDDLRIVTSTDGKRGDVSNSCQGLQFWVRLCLRSKK